jgi:hypothetical protein
MKARGEQRTLQKVKLPHNENKKYEMNRTSSRQENNEKCTRPFGEKLGREENSLELRA